jgi:hypothetical protein
VLAVLLALACAGKSDPADTAALQDTDAPGDDGAAGDGAGGSGGGGDDGGASSAPFIDNWWEPTAGSGYPTGDCDPLNPPEGDLLECLVCFSLVEDGGVDVKWSGTWGHGEDVSGRMEGTDHLLATWVSAGVLYEYTDEEGTTWEWTPTEDGAGGWDMAVVEKRGEAAEGFSVKECGG